MNFRVNRSLYRLDKDFNIYFLCPDSNKFEPLLHSKAKCTTCQQAANLRAFTSAVNDYRRLKATYNSKIVKESSTYWAREFGNQVTR